MNVPARAWRAGSAAILLALACGLSGCGLPGSTGSSAATAPHSSPSASGQWVYTDPHTVEKLRLHQNKDGTVSGDGTSAVDAGHGKIDHSAIAIRHASIHDGALRLTLLITALDWNASLTLAENLRCTVVPRVLHCRTDIPLYRIRNVKQDFVRRA